MNPIHFPEANIRYGPPADLVESQVMTIYAYQGKSQGGSVDGAPVIVVAWQPTPAELERLNQGAPLFLSFMCDGLPPHFPSLDFHAATHPA